MVSSDISPLKCLACEAPYLNAPAQSTAAESAAPKFVFGVQPSSTAPSTEAKKDAPTFSFGAPSGTTAVPTTAPAEPP